MSTLSTNNFTELATGDTVPAKYLVHGSAKAWANLDGTDTIALKNSLNISSVVDNGTGGYTKNFTNAFITNFYSVSGSAISVNRARIYQAANAVGFVLIYISTDAGAASDSFNTTTIHGDLA
jgi:hypothetical protein